MPGTIPDTDPPTGPVAGKLLPRAAEAFGVRYKLETYSLAPTNEVAAPKVRGFKQILAITIEDIDYLEGAIYTGAVLVPVSEVRDNPPWGPKCVVDLPIRGRGEKRGRIANVRTVWEIAGNDAPPRLVNAYCKP
jgi:hypothetical protein